MGRRVGRRGRYGLTVAALLAVFAAVGWMRADGTGAPTMGAGDAFILSALGIGSAAAQSTPRKGFVVNQRTFLDSCPPGHRIRFRSDTMSLHVDPRSFDSISIGDLATVFENRCPLEAVLVPQQFKHGFFFGRAALAAANTPPNLGSSFFRLITGFVPRREDKPFPGGPREAVKQPSIFDVPPPFPSGQSRSRPTRCTNYAIPTMAWDRAR